MKRIIILAALLSGSAFAESYQSPNPEVMSTRITPCRSWTYSFEARGYVCNSYEFGVEVVDAGDIRRLEQRVRDLEAKLATVEAQ